jgi:Peptidase C39 family
MLALIVLFTRFTGMSYDASLTALSVQQAVQTTTLSATQTTLPATATTNRPAVSPSGNASLALKRINQLDCGQYASAYECNIWAYSACSTAAITEVFDAYGYHYRITDILQQEVAAQAITPALGLVNDQGIQRTAARFGFTTDWGYARSYRQVVALANAGTPVIVSWPPARYDGGHLVVITGGNDTSVRLADSSRYDRTSLSRTQFMKWWAGFSAVLKPGAYSFIGKPTLSASFINQVLASYHSPADDLGQQLYSLGVKYGIDPAYALAFFMHESLFGTTGEARKTMALGNERCIADRPCVDQAQGGYAQMESWTDGFDHWYRLILNGYIYGGVTLSLVGHPCLTIGQTIPVYAPSSDHNDVTGYIAALQQELQTWHAGQLRP